MFGRLWRKIKGFRTYIGAGLLSLFGLTSLLGMIDITPIIALFVKNPETLSTVTILLGVAFGILRAVSYTSPGGTFSALQSAPVSKRVDEGT